MTQRETITRCNDTDLPADTCAHCRTHGATSTYDAARNTWPAKVEIIRPRPVKDRPSEPIRVRYIAPDVEDVHDPIVKVARDLTEILNMVPDLRKATRDAFAEDYLLGGVALVALAPIANPEDWERRFQLIAATGGDLAYLNDHRDNEQPPHQRIAWWSFHFRRAFGQDWDHLAVYETEVPFLRQNLDAIVNRQDPIEFKAFAADINTARVHLENALHAGVRVHRSEVRCTNCDSGKRLVRVYANTAADDGYRCPNPACKARYDAAQFARARFQQMVSKNADRHVKSQDARDAIHRPPRTWRKWLRYGHVRFYRDPISGQVWVWWPDVVEANEVATRRERTRPA